MGKEIGKRRGRVRGGGGKGKKEKQYVVFDFEIHSVELGLNN